MRSTLAVALLFAVAGCPSGDKSTGDAENTDVTDTTDVTDAAGVCVSDKYWTQGDHESPLMHPGGACIECHTQRHEGPTFDVAGTVFTNVDEPTDCNGVKNMKVEIVDANGDVVPLTTNAAGNFYLNKSQSNLVFPITARVVDGADVRSMGTPVATGDCNSCHTQDGRNGAPGRVQAP